MLKVDTKKAIMIFGATGALGRELSVQADKIGCHIITVTKDIIKKLKFINYNLEEYSLDTVKAFYKDAVEANFKIDVT